MKKITVPLKLIFFGEHLVLHGHEALSLPLRSKKLWLTYQASANDIIQNLPPATSDALMSDIDWVRKNYKSVQNKYSITVSSSIPPGYGAGVSAAWSVALVRLLLPDRSDQIDALTHLENRHHGQASGVDHETIFFDCAIAKQNDVTTRLSSEKFFLSKLINQTYGLVSKSAPVESTKDMIKIFAQHYQPNNLPKLCSVSALQAIMIENDAAKYYAGINTYGKVLEAHHVTPDSFATIAKKFRSDGGAIKICGAGARNGGFGLAIAAHPDPAKIVQIAHRLDAEFFLLR